VGCRLRTVPPSYSDDDVRRVQGRRIAAARAANQLSQGQLAAKLTAAGVRTSTNAVSAWETGVNSAGPARQIALAHILGCPLGDLFDVLDEVLEA
jgi:transcriptional regulator with XRE-family HTH domain